MLAALVGGIGAACAAGWIWGLWVAPNAAGALVALVGSTHALFCAVFGVLAAVGFGALRRLGVWAWCARRLASTSTKALAIFTALGGLTLGGLAAATVYLLGWEVRALPWATAGALATSLLAGGAMAWLLYRRGASRLAWMGAAGIGTVTVVAFAAGWTSDVRGPEVIGALEDGGLTGRVIQSARASRDSDSDGYPLAFCDDDCDCDDAVASVNPGADEVADNGVDEDCDGADLTAADLAAFLGSEGLARDSGPSAMSDRGEPKSGGTPLIPGSSVDNGETNNAPSAAALVKQQPGPPPWQRRYNVLLIVMDTVRADHLSFMGYERKTSPRMDALAERSIVFTQARVQGSMTRESLPSIFTGRYFEELHRRDQEWPKFHDDNLMLAERFKAAGYSTYGINSFIYVVPHFGFAQGFDTFETRILEERAKVHWNRTSDLVTDYTLAAVDRMGAEKPGVPWFVFAHYADPHAGYLRHPESPRFGGFTADKYDEEIYFTDLHIGRLLDGLQARDLTKDTVVVITSDHGEGLRRDEDHGGIYHGQHLYDTLVHVPLIFTVPGLAPRRDAEPVGAIDIVPTLIDLVGLPKDVGEPLSGRSLAPQIAGINPRPKRGPVFMTKFRPSTRAKVGMVDWPYKVVWNVPINRWELYDLAADTGEKRNLAKRPEHDKRLLNYQRIVKTWRSHVLKRRPSREADEPPSAE